MWRAHTSASSNCLGTRSVGSFMTLTMLLVAGGASVMLLLREAAPGGRTRSRVYTWPAMASECLAALSADWTVGGWVIVCELVENNYSHMLSLALQGGGIPGESQK